MSLKGFLEYGDHWHREFLLMIRSFFQAIVELEGEFIGHGVPEARLQHLRI